MAGRFNAGGFPATGNPVFFRGGPFLKIGNCPIDDDKVNVGEKPIWFLGLRKCFAWDGGSNE